MKKNSISKQQVVLLQSRGEAHLYVAIAKADGIVSKKERAFIGAYASGAQKLYDVLAINSELAKQVQRDIKEILNDPTFRSWSTDEHYNEALLHLKKAQKLGNWSVALSSLKHEHGLLQVALLDEYIFVESKAVKDIVRKLQRDLGQAAGK